MCSGDGWQRARRSEPQWLQTCAHRTVRKHRSSDWRCGTARLVRAQQLDWQRAMVQGVQRRLVAAREARRAIAAAYMRSPTRWCGGLAAGRRREGRLASATAYFRRKRHASRRSEARERARRRSAGWQVSAGARLGGWVSHRWKGGAGARYTGPEGVCCRPCWGVRTLRACESANETGLYLPSSRLAYPPHEPGARGAHSHAERADARGPE